jgi:hypothetical protein
MKDEPTERSSASRVADVPGKQPSRQMVELLCKALLDTELCDRFFADPEVTAQEFGLEGEEVKALKRLDRQVFEQKIIELRSA